MGLSGWRSEAEPQEAKHHENRVASCPATSSPDHQPTEGNATIVLSWRWQAYTPESSAAMRYFSFLAVFVWIALIPARAVQDADGSFSNFSAPTDLDIANWDSGWGTNPAGVTGWNYVGLITIPEGFLSGVYLGNGYVLTAAHGGTTFDNFTLNGVSYTPVTGSVQTFTTFGDGTGGQADLLLFKIAPSPSLTLPPLTLASGVPVGYDSTTDAPGSSTVIVGYGNPLALETWGAGTVFQTDGTFAINSEITPFQLLNSVDYDIFNSNSGEPDSSTNEYNLYPGDSGGADFIDNNGTWELAGINEFVATDTTTGQNFASGFVQVDDYLDQLNAGMTPEPSTYVLLGAGPLIGLTLVLRRRQG